MEKKINVFQIAGGYDCKNGPMTMGGVEIHLLYMNRKMDYSRFHIVVGYNEKGVLINEYKNSDLWDYEDFCIEKRIDINSLKKLLSIVKKHQINVIHAHGELGILYSLIVSKLLKVPAVFTFPRFPYNDGIKAIIFKYFYRLAFHYYDKVITVSKLFAQELIRIYSLKENKVCTIYNGINLSDFQNIENDYIYEEFKISRKKTIIGIAGQLQDIKAHEYFIEAAYILCKNRKDLFFLVVGGGPRRKKIDEMIKSYNMESQFILTGFRKDIINLISIMDILVNTSLREGIPMAFLEAMALSKPIVATDAGGNREAVLDGETGFITPQRDSKAIAGAIEKLLDNKEMREQFGKAGRKHLENHFLAERMAREHEKLYFELIEKSFAFAAS